MGGVMAYLIKDNTITGVNPKVTPITTWRTGSKMNRGTCKPLCISHLITCTREAPKETSIPRTAMPRLYRSHNPVRKRSPPIGGLGCFPDSNRRVGTSKICEVPVRLSVPSRNTSFDVARREGGQSISRKYFTLLLASASITKYGAVPCARYFLTTPTIAGNVLPGVVLPCRLDHLVHCRTMLGFQTKISSRDGPSGPLLEKKLSSYNAMFWESLGLVTSECRVVADAAITA